MKLRLMILAMLTVLFLCVGCSRGNNNPFASSKMTTQAYGNYEMAEEIAYATADSASIMYDEAEKLSRSGGASSDGRIDPSISGSANTSEFERKLVKTADITIRVENIDTTETIISDLLEKYNGYSASTNVSENFRYYSLRIPAHFYDIFLAEMNGIGRLMNRYENTEDVTIRYYDLEGRLDSKKALLSTFQSYLRRANNMEEILAVEARIAELQYDIEFTGTQLRDLSNRVDYATISLNIHGPVKATQNQNITFGERIKRLFGSFGGFLSSTAVFLLGLIIFGIPILLIIVLLFWLLFGKVGLLRKLWRLVTAKK